MSGDRQDIPPSTTRREFMTRAAAAGLCLAGAGGLAAWLHDSRPPAITPAEAKPVSLPDYSVKGVGPIMAMVQGSDRVKTVRAGLKALGGMAAFIKPGDRVFIKVNAAFASPPALGATTHPDLLAEVVRQCRAAGADAVVVSDNPINDPASCFRLSGLMEAASQAGARLVLPTPEHFRPTTLAKGRLIVDWPLLYGPLQGINRVIGLAPVKDHHRSGASMSMKNWYGLLGGPRNLFHQDINTIISELAQLMRPTLVILDGTVSMMTNGPTGGSLEDLKPTGLMIVSTDQVAADAAGAELLGRRPADLPWLAMAEAAGAGRVDFKALSPKRLEA